MLELGSSGSVRGVLGNEHPYRDPPKRTLPVGPSTDATHQRAAFPEQLALDLRTVESWAQFGHNRPRNKGLRQ